jgi:hypothetical protein
MVHGPEVNMTSVLLREFKLPPDIIFGIVFLGYAVIVCIVLINGYTREITGWRHVGRPSRLHKLLYQWHTGLHLHPDRTYGDEHWRRSVSGGPSRSTSYTPWKRWHRAVRNNAITVLWLLSICGMAIDPPATISSITILLMLTVVGLIAYVIRRKRTAIIRNRPPSSQPAWTMTIKAKTVFGADPTTVGSRPVLEAEARPKLAGVPQATLAQLLAPRMNCSAAEIVNRFSMDVDKGELRLPDSFAALVREREPIQEIIEAHTEGPVRFEWKTTIVPRRLSWFPVTQHSLPDAVRFRDYLSQIEALGPRDLAVGVVADRSMFSVTHTGDNPWHCRFAGSGTGKSMGFLVKAAQICHKDPDAEVYCIDTKQVSFEYLRGIPRVYVFDNPQSEMDKIYQVFYTLAGIMRDRYTAVREGRNRYTDFHDIWVFTDEGNDLGAQMKSYWKNVLGETSASPAVWGEAIGPLLRQGRQANMFGEFMFQDLTDRAMGGESLKMAFNVFGAAGYLPGQFTRTIGPPAVDCIEGPGKILICKGNRRTWVQGFYDDEQWLHDYALENRKEMVGND